MTSVVMKKAASTQIFLLTFLGLVQTGRETGASIGNNTRLTQLDVDISDIPSAVVEDRRFFDGQKRNTSIRNLYCDGVFVVGGEFMKY